MMLKSLLFLSATIVYVKTLSPLESLTLDYQEVAYDDSDNTFQIGLNYVGNCDVFSVQFFLEEDIISGANETYRRFEVPTSERTISIPAEDFRNSLVYFRVVAIDGNQTVCSDYYSLHTFYRLLETSIEVQHHLVFDTISLPIPNTQYCSHTTLIWPKPSDPDDHCLCPALQSTNHYTFDACAKFCTGDDSVQLVNNTVIFNNITTYAGEFLVHYICNLDVCNDQNCFLQLVVTSHRLIPADEIANATTISTFQSAPTLLSSLDMIVITSSGSVIALLVLIVAIAITVATTIYILRRDQGKYKVGEKEDKKLYNYNIEQS